MVRTINFEFNSTVRRTLSVTRAIVGREHSCSVGFVAKSLPTFSYVFNQKRYKYVTFNISEFLHTFS